MTRKECGLVTENLRAKYRTLKINNVIRTLPSDFLIFMLWALLQRHLCIGEVILNAHVALMNNERFVGQSSITFSFYYKWPME